MQFVTDSKVQQEEIDKARSFGVELGEHPDDPKNFIIAFLKQLLLQRKKLKYLVKDGYLNKDVSEWWDKLLFSLEEQNRKLLKVESGSIIFTLFCPTEKSFEQLKETTWHDRVDKRLQRFIRTLGKSIQVPHN